jgi:uroporphyrinogen-III synthase
MGKLIARTGAIPLHAPALAEIPAVDHDELRTWLAAVSGTSDHVVIFQTGVGVAALFEAFATLALEQNFRDVLTRA